MFICEVVGGVCDVAAPVIDGADAKFVLGVGDLGFSCTSRFFVWLAIPV